MSERLTEIKVISHEQVTETNRPAPGTLILGPTWKTLICPTCGKGASLSEHTVTLNSDGTYTVNPSCVCPRKECGAHYFITKNQIQWS